MPEDAYVECKLREYLAALQQQPERHAYERAVVAEEERYCARLAALAQRECMCRRAAQPRCRPRGWAPPCTPLDAPVPFTLLPALPVVSITVHAKLLNSMHPHQPHTSTLAPSKWGDHARPPVRGTLRLPCSWCSYIACI